MAIWIVFFGMLHSADAEYRAFELVIENPKTKTSKTLISNLDPWQFPTYYPLEADETIRYTKTWRCKGNTSNFKPICPPSSFKAQVPTQTAKP